MIIDVSDVLLAQFGAKLFDIISFFSNLGYARYTTGRDGRLEKIDSGEITGFNNLWPILPGHVEELSLFRQVIAGPTT